MDTVDFAGLSGWGIWQIHPCGGSGVARHKAARFVGAVTERPGAGLAAAAEGDGPLVGRELEFPASVVGHPQPHLRLAIDDREFDDERPMFPTPDRDHRAAG
jgi:hypothetical protein